MGEGGNATPKTIFPPPPGKDSVPIAREAGWAPGSVWIGAENLTPTGIRSPDRPACSQSLYRLSYRGPQIINLDEYVSNFTMNKRVFLLLPFTDNAFCIGRIENSSWI